MLNDEEGDRIPEGLPPVIDAHVHLFPDELFNAVWLWFGQFGWPVRYQLKTETLAGFLAARGVRHIVALHYAHKPGAARQLNEFMAGLCHRHPGITGMATVYPGERNAADILEEAFQLGLSGVKLHCHVQCFDMTSDDMGEIYTACVRHNKPLVMHVGREPKSPAYPCDPYELCSAEKLENVLKSFPTLKICVPHMGADEFEAYARMIEGYDTLWLDTTMALADYLPMDYEPPLADMRTDRIMYGTDFPNLPYAWDRELKRLCKLDLPDDVLAKILSGNAIDFFSISE